MRSGFATRVDNEIKTYLRRPAHDEVDLVYEKAKRNLGHHITLKILLIWFSIQFVIAQVSMMLYTVKCVLEKDWIMLMLLPFELILVVICAGTLLKIYDYVVKDTINKRKNLESIKNNNVAVADCTIHEIVSGNAPKKNLRGMYIIDFYGQYIGKRAFDEIDGNSSLRVGAECLYVCVFDKNGKELEQFLIAKQCEINSEGENEESGDTSEIDSEESRVYYGDEIKDKINWKELDEFRYPTMDEHRTLCNALLQSLNTVGCCGVVLAGFTCITVLPVSIGLIIDDFNLLWVFLFLLFLSIPLSMISIGRNNEKLRKIIYDHNYVLIKCKITDYKTVQHHNRHRTSYRDQVYIVTSSGKAINDSFVMYDSRGIRITDGGKTVAGYNMDCYLVKIGNEIPKVILRDVTVEQLRKMYNEQNTDN